MMARGRGRDWEGLLKEKVCRARGIVGAHEERLSGEPGGAIGVEVVRHYTYLSRVLLEAHQNPMEADLDLLHGKLVELRDTWVEAVRIYSEESYGAARAS